jgi:hypothetical protein
MSSTSWSNNVNGDWNTSSKWTDGVPTASGTALITVSGTYTVTSSQENDVETLEMHSGATLDINAHHVGISEGTGSSALAGTIEITSGAALLIGGSSVGTTCKNTGTIIIQEDAVLKVKDVVDLNGSGKIKFTGLGRLVADTGGGKLTNKNTISGPGVIGDASVGAAFAFINGSEGVINGDGTTVGLGTTLLLDVGIFSEGQGATNNGLMQASGSSGSLSVIGHIQQGTSGQFKSATSGAVVQLAGAKISGGTVSTVVGATLLAQEGDNEIITTTPITNAGMIEADSNLTITGSINNSGSLVIKGSLRVIGEVIGGTANIYGSGKLEFGGSASTNVTFESGSNGTLILHLPAGEKFTGTVAGMDVNPGASINLSHIPYADNPTLSFDSTTGVVTVTDAHLGRTVIIKTVAPAGTTGGAFFVTVAADNSTLIFAG